MKRSKLLNKVTGTFTPSVEWTFGRDTRDMGPAGCAGSITRLGLQLTTDVAVTEDMPGEYKELAFRHAETGLLRALFDEPLVELYRLKDLMYRKDYMGCLQSLHRLEDIMSEFED